MATWEQVQQYGKAIYGIPIYPYKGHYSTNTFIVGFDTEYDSKTRTLLSIQLADNKGSQFFEVKKDFQLTPEGKVTSKEFRKLLWKFFVDGHGKREKSIRHKSIILYSYWSVAELQHFILSDDTIISENPFTYTLKIHQDQHNRIEILDLFVWYQAGLNQLAKDLLQREKKEYDTTNITEKDLLNPVFKEYALYDAELCYEIAATLRKRFWDLFNVDIVLTQTAAATSAAAFRKKYIVQPLYQSNTNVRRQALLSNWGGSSTAFYRGIFKDIFYYYDGISMYPTTAISLKYLPVGRDWFEVTNVKDYLKINGICKVSYKFKDNENYPCLLTVPDYPFTKQIFPITGISHTTGQEVKLALQKNADIELLYGYGYETGLPALPEYLKELVNKKAVAKKEDNKVDTFIYKLMANSIIGKFKQTIYKDDINELIKWSKIFSTKNMDAGLKHLSTGSIFMPEWNSIILGYARAISNQAFKKTKAFVGTVDSVITRIDLGEKFLIDDIIYEKKFTGTELGILRAKSYYLLEGSKAVHIAHHGFKGKPEDFVIAAKEHINDNYITYKKRQPVKLRSAIRRHLKFGEFIPIQTDYSMHYDNSRKLLVDNSTQPWKNIKEYIVCEGKMRKENKIIKKVYHDKLQKIFRDYTEEKKK